MNQATSITRPTMAPRTALSVEQLKKQVPSIFATKPSNRMGERYTFISTLDILEAFTRLNLVPVEASQRRSTDSTSARHLVRFARKQDITATVKRNVGEVIPEVVLSSSHNGRAAFKLFFGLFRFVCGNGLIVADALFAGMVRRHIGDIKDITEEAETVIGRTGEVVRQVTAMQKTMLKQPARLNFAESALRLRYLDADSNKVIAPIDASKLLEIRRPQDEGMDLWHTFNVVQENLMHGGLEGRSALGRTVHTRQVQDVRKVLTYNTDLWSLAAERIAA